MLCLTEGGEFQFRSDKDLIEGWVTGSGIKDFNHDGKLEFIDISRFPHQFERRDSHYVVPVPKVFRWTAVDGFKDVSDEFPDYFRIEVLPDLTKQMSVEASLTRKQLFSNAIEYISTNVLRKTAKPSGTN